MGKRSNFARHKNDAYATWDPRAIAPLLPFLRNTEFIEPCAGDGTLIDALENRGLRCSLALDIEPRRADIRVGDARTIKTGGKQTITNPPWTRPLLHEIIENLAPQGDTWLLFDVAWAFTRQARFFMPHCHAIVAVGRLRWIMGTKHDAQDDCAWYLFGPNPPAAPHLFCRA